MEPIDASALEGLLATLAELRVIGDTPEAVALHLLREAVARELRADGLLRDLSADLDLSLARAAEAGGDG